MKNTTLRELDTFTPSDQRRAAREYFAQAAGWDADLFVSIKRSERNAWFVAGLSLSMVAVMAGAIFQMLPLKTTEPYVIKVDNSTGIVEVVDALRTSTSNYSEAIARYFLAKYIRAREGYAFSKVDQDYLQLAIMSTTQEFRQVQAYLLPRNPDSPVNKLGERGTLDIKIKSIAFIKQNVATVRYMKIERNAGSVVRQTHWISTVEFIYDQTPMSARDREVSPLGFKVTEYRTDPEVITNSRDVPPDSTTPLLPAKGAQIPLPDAPAAQTRDGLSSPPESMAAAPDYAPTPAALAVPEGISLPGIAQE
jgi:type IV secretion system protein VirB8